MKFFSSLALSALFATAALAQGTDIGAPADGATVKAGSNITVEIDRPDTLTGSTEVAVIIGFESCVELNFCPPPSSLMGTILYNGPFDPEFHTDVTPGKPPYQNFTVTIPSSAPAGAAQLNLAHFSLVGASLYPFLETHNITLNVVV
ncbi:hypothetical protein K438DRAFT_1952957 [Mycena galopus ATCC 62051]|nr:hypothetical protein K438DRAFT_1952957 [Mycena galopus ATCC 62051]